MEKVGMVVARGRTVRDGDRDYNPGETVLLNIGDAALLAERGFVVTPDEAASGAGPIVIRAENHGPAKIGLMSGAGTSWHDQLAASRGTR